MNVREVLEQLKGRDPDAPVVFEYPSGDYWRRNVVAPVRHVNEDTIVYSEYHSQDTRVLPDEHTTDDTRMAVILS